MFLLLWNEEGNTKLFYFILLYRGYKRYFKRTVLETSDFLKDDCLEIHCVVGVVKSHTEGPKIYSITAPPSDIGQHFGKLLESGKLTDVNFEVDGETFSAHKLVLAARSPVFRAQLFGPLKDQNTECIKVEDMEAPVFKVLSPFHVSLSFRGIYQCDLSMDCFCMYFLEELFFCSAYHSILLMDLISFSWVVGTVYGGEFISSKFKFF